MNVRTSFTALALLFLGWSAAHAEQYTVPLFLAPGTSGDPQGVLRLVNDTGEAATVQVFAIADDGTRAGPATIALGASAAAEFDATELQSANAVKGLSGGLGSFSGDVRLLVDSDAPIVPLAFVRASDGTLSAMHDAVRAATTEAGQHSYEVPIFNLSTAVVQASRLRLINPGDTPAAVVIEGRDDGASAATGTVRLSLPAGGARTLTAQQLEAGGTGLTGQLGAGIGRWRLTVTSDRPLSVVNVAASSTGYWNNLSTTAVRGAAPTDRAGFNDRFVGESVVLEVEGGRFELMFMENGRVSETVQTDGMFATGEGGYDYVGLGPDAGRLTLDYDDGEQCRSNWYFSSRMGGWFASHCTGGLDAEETWSGGNWFVEGEEDDGGGDGGPIETTYGVNDALPGVPTSGVFVPARLSGASVRASGGGTTIDLNDGGHIELNDGTRYTCASAGGCEIVDGTVTRGSVTGRTAGSGGGEIDRFPVFPAAGRPGDRTYTVGTAIDALTLPEATGGNPPLTYSLSPDVPGLSFDAAARGLTGTPTEAGSYAMSYTATDADGDLHTLHFTVEVGAGEADDHGDTFDTATSVSIPSTTPGELEEGKEDGDRDYFRVVVAAAGALTVETTGRVDTYGTLFDANRTQLATNDDGGSGTNFKIERQVQAGTYYVEVRGFRPTRTGTYELRVSAADDTSGGDGGGGQATTFGSGDTISSLPSGNWFPDVTSGGSFSSSGGNVTIQLNNGGYVEEGDYRYTCQSAAGCTVRNRSVQSGTIAQTSKGTAPGDNGTGQGARPSFAAGSGPGNQTYTVGTAISALSLPTASGGDGALTYSLSPEVPGLTFNATASVRRLSGTPTTAGTYDMTYRARDVDGDTDSLSFTITVESAGGAAPSSPRNISVNREGSNVRVSWDASTGATHYEVWRCDTRGGTPIDCEDGIFFERSNWTNLAGNVTATSYVDRSPPTSTSIIPFDIVYVVQACNSSGCSGILEATDPGGGGGTGAPTSDLTVSSVSVSNSNPAAGASFTLRATVRNDGDASSAVTTLRYYRSTNATISRSDTQVGTDSVSGLSASRTSAESISLTAPSSAGTYYYGACVDSVTGESDTDNNCSSGVRVAVVDDPSGGSGDGVCRAGLVVNPGESCTYKGSTFSVSSSGRGSIAFFGSGTSIDTRGSTVNGVRWNFYASKNSGSNSWTIHVAD